MSRPEIHPARKTRRSRLAGSVVLLLLAPPAGADWLITLEGSMIETAGPWTIEDGTLPYTDVDGEQHALDGDELDLEASEETTALRAGKPFEPRGEAEEADDGKQGKKRRQKDEPKVILYTTSLCQECSRVQKLLEHLDVDFVAKDINSSPTARREYRKKAGHGGGLPVVDVDGALVFSGNPRVIRQRVREMRVREAAEEQAPPSPAGDSREES